MKTGYGQEIIKMDKHLQTILDYIQQNNTVSVKEKTALLEAVAIQERELKIEAALERVRARTMEMQKSNELTEASNLLYQQLQFLDIPLFSAGYCIWDDQEKQSATFWMSSQGNLQPPFKVPLHIDTIFQQYKNASENGVEFYAEAYNGKKLENHYKNIWALPDVQAMIVEATEQEFEIPQIPTSQVNHIVYFKHGFLLFTTYEPIPEAHDIFKRFGKLFDQTYTRFLDLQKAEAQAREAQIEAALERVRSRMMGMQKSSELEETSIVMHQQFNALGIVPEGAPVYIVIIDNKTETAMQWTVNDTSSVMPNLEGAEEWRTPMTEHPELIKTYKAWKRKEPILIRDLTRKKLTAFLEYIKSLPSNKEKEIPLEQIPDRMIWSEASFSYGTLGMIHLEPLPEETLDILLRFAKVFEQTYTRFLDLQKAEAQAREAQIETALERVRSRSMAMHKSTELNEVVAGFYEQLMKLGLAKLGFEIILCKEQNSDLEYWHANPVQSVFPECYYASRHVHPFFEQLWNAWKEGLPRLIIEQKGKEKRAFDKVLFEQTDFKKVPEETKQWIRSEDITVFSNVIMKYGLLSAADYVPVSDINFLVLHRFSNVFEQCYTRFLDLQKAETQAREAQIEVALERVRARALAMQSPDDLIEVVTVLREQMKFLGQTELEASIIQLYEKNSKKFESWYAYRPSNDPEGELVLDVANATIENSEFAQEIIKKYLSPETDYTIESSGKKLKEWYGVIKASAPLTLDFDKKGKMIIPEKLYYHFSNFSGGSLMMVSNHLPNEEAKELQHRTAKVFNLAYKRFLDLQKAEAQAREAQIEAALERMRSRTMAMQKTDELLETGELLYRELNKLGIPSLTSGYSLMDADEKIVRYYVPSPVDGTIEPDPIRTPCTETAVMRSITASWKKQEAFNVIQLNPKETIDHQTFIADRSTNFRHSAEELISFSPEELALHTFNFEQGYLLIVGGEKLTDEQIDIMLRFTKVFDRTYRRFLDLQKAEAQAREAQIEIALERVRAKALAMQSSNDLIEVATVLREQMKFLGQSQLEASVIHLYKNKSKTFEAWYSYRPSNDLKGELILDETIVTIKNSEWAREVIRKYSSPETDYTIESSGKKLKEWYEDLKTVAPLTLDYDKKGTMIIPEKLYYHFSNFSGGSLMMVSNHLPNEEAKELQHRTAKVFDLAYKRFLDLQKAEEQAREAQIEAALERVRSRSMAMHKSEDLAEAAELLYQQLNDLGVKSWTCGYVFIEEEKEHAKVWMIEPNGKFFWGLWTCPLREEKVLKSRYNSWKRKEDLHISILRGQDNIDHHTYIATHSPFNLDKTLTQLPTDVTLTSAHFSYGYLLVITTASLSIDQENLLKRFAKVFEQTYTRFLDLQKAEEQAREAQIEAALEKVRSKSMAMHSTEDLQQCAAELFQQLEILEIEPWRCGLAIAKPMNDKIFNLWSVTTSENKKKVSVIGQIEATGHPIVLKIREAWKTHKSMFSYELSGQKMVDYFKYITKDFPLPEGNTPEKKLPDCLHYYHATFHHGTIYGAFLTPLAKEQIETLERFAKVFEQTYTRFLDLQKAEEQAREAQIEAALERVRSRSMAMQNSSELGEILMKIFEELTSLELALTRCIIWIFEPDGKSLKWYSANPENKTMINSFFMPYFDHPSYRKYLKEWKEQKELTFFINEGKTKVAWDNFLFSQSDLKHLPKEVQEGMRSTKKLYMSNTFNKFGVLFTNSLEPLSDKNNAILIRFGKVLEQAYTRFKDIEQAEERAKETIKSASIDRVRAEISSMRYAADLERITPLIWKELKILGVPFIRCGVFIMDEKRKMIQSHLSTPDGKSLAVFEMPFDTLETSTNMVLYWKKKEMYQDYMTKDQFFQFMQNLVDNGFIEDMDIYQGTTTPPESLHLNFIPFQQGMLYVGNTEPLTKDQMELVQSLTATFSGAYARYEDFNQLEAAKKKVENTLTNLKSAQSQLIQSEKMASLGELTAGIAHEIQNPLNFVNNFSEVSEELLEELEEEIENNSKEDINEIITDLKQNLNKINHHGQRASGIVKGMLDHSRTNNGKKEFTDLNLLADEYLRLSYHGLRAKDKSFNADFKMDLDENLPKIKVVPQDIGRVLLNLINNAFYATVDKSKKANENYKPVVIVSSKKKQNSIEITVNDNGNGIPKDIVDKIFQPFFTTKPTGQGTGLGLSLSYDIVQAHGGELKVKTKEGEGTTFIINLKL